MPVNYYFQRGVNIGSNQEQLLIENLVAEHIKVAGFEMFYIPRSTVKDNDILNEDILNKYANIYSIEMYLTSIDGFEGDGSLLSKFGVEIRDSASFVVSKKRWHETIGDTGNVQLTTRPTEGDVLYFPLTKAFLEIRRVVSKNPFFQVGKLYVYTLETELMQFTHERFETGIAEIDDTAKSFSLDAGIWHLLLEDGNPLLLETYSKEQLILEEFTVIEIDQQSQNEDIDELGRDLLFNANNPFGSPKSIR